MTDNTTAARLRSFIERLERLETERSELADDIKAVLSEAKGDGFDTTIIKQVLRIRKLDPSKREEAESLLETYLSALGM